MKERVIICIILLLVAYSVRGCEEPIDERFICPHCHKHTDFLLKADPVVLERRVGAVAEVNYRLFCTLCDTEIDMELLE